MPFKSDKQRKWMHANEPEMAKDWERKKKKSGAVNESSYTQRSILDFIKANKAAVESDPANIPRIKLFGPKQDSKYLNMSLIGLAKIAKIVKNESVNEVQKRQATDIAVKFDKAYLNFSREIRDIIKMVVRITGNNTDGKIFDKAYKKQLIPFNALFKSWYKGQQDNPHIKESDIDEGFGGELKGKDKEKFEKARKENAEQLGYKLTGKSDIKEAKSKTIKTIGSIIGKRQAQKIDGHLVDMQTAHVIMKVWNALNPSNRKKFEKLSIKKMADVAWKLMK